MKKIFLFITSILFAYTIAYYSKQNNQIAKTPNFPGQWETYSVNKEKELASHLSTSKELEKARLKIAKKQTSDKKENISRRPSSIKTAPPYRMWNGRILTGDFNEGHLSSNSRLQMANRYNPKWKERAGHDLLRFQDETVKVLIKEENSVIEITNNVGRLFEQAHVTYLNEDGSSSSFKALIDSESGLVIRTWDRTIREDTHKSRENLGGFSLEQDNGIITK